MGSSDPCVKRRFSCLIYEFLYYKLLKMQQNMLKCDANLVATCILMHKIGGGAGGDGCLDKNVRMVWDGGWGVRRPKLEWCDIWIFLYWVIADNKTYKPYTVAHAVAVGKNSLYKIIQIQKKEFIVLGGRPLATIKDWIYNAYSDVKTMDKLHFWEQH